MCMSDNVFAPGLKPNSVRAANGVILTVPEGWILLPPGDAAITRRAKAAYHTNITSDKSVFETGSTLKEENNHDSEAI